MKAVTLIMTCVLYALICEFFKLPLYVSMPLGLLVGYLASEIYDNFIA